MKLSYNGRFPGPNGAIDLNFDGHAGQVLQDVDGAVGQVTEHRRRRHVRADADLPRRALVETARQVA